MLRRLLNLIPSITLSLVILITMTSNTYVNNRDLSIGPLKPINSAPFITDDTNLDSTEDTMTYHAPATKIPTDNSHHISYMENPFRNYINTNADFIGWVQIPGTEIDTLIVQSQDNQYYLKRDFYGNASKSGTVFMDYRNAGFDFSKHIILYGHNMKDGSMFGDLDLYKQEDHAINNNIIVIHDLYRTRHYEIYASYFTKADPSLINYITENHNWKDYITQQLNMSDINYGMTPDKTGRFLSLVTCSYEQDDGRFFIHAVEVPTK